MSKYFKIFQFVLWIWVAGSTHATDKLLDQIIVVINNDVIMQSELNQRFRWMRDQMSQQGVNMPPEEVLKNQVLDDLINNELQLQIARSLSIKVEDDVLNKTIKNIAEGNNMTLQMFSDLLEKDGYNYDQFREQIRDEITITRLRQQNIESRISVNDLEIDRFLEQEGLQTADTEVRLKHILIAVSGDSSSSDVTEEAKKMADKIREEARSGEDFSELARIHSDSTTAEQGGDLGWNKISELPSLFIRYVPDMIKGDISQVIKNESGFHIIKLAEIKEQDPIVIQQTRVRHILLELNPLAEDQELEEKLKKLRTRVIEGDDFDLLAKAHSDDAASAIEGGDLGWVTPGQLVPEFEKVMNELKESEISMPFKTNFGWHIIEVLGRRQYDDTQSIKRQKVRRILYDRKLKEEYRQWLARIRDEAYIEYRLR